MNRTALSTGLYAYLFTLLQMEDYALLMGALGLFLILGALMFFTRRVNGYGARTAQPAPGEAPAPGAAGTAGMPGVAA